MSSQSGFDRDEAALVFRRAIELEASRPDSPLQGSELEDIGREVGISPASVRSAVAELRDSLLQPPDDDQPWDVLIARVLPGPRDAVLLLVDQYARRSLLVRVGDRGSPTSTATWRRGRDARSHVARRLGPLALRPLTALDRLDVTVAGHPSAPGLVAVLLRARLVRPAVRVLSARRQAVLAAGVVGGLGATFAVAGQAEWLVGAGSVVVNGWLAQRAVRRHAAVVQGVEQSIERFVDHLGPKLVAFDPLWPDPSRPEGA